MMGTNRCDIGAILDHAAGMFDSRAEDLRWEGWCETFEGSGLVFGPGACAMTQAPVIVVEDFGSGRANIYVGGRLWRSGGVGDRGIQDVLENRSTRPPRRKK